MKKLKQDIISGYKISKNEALKLYDKNFNIIYTDKNDGACL